MRVPKDVEPEPMPVGFEMIKRGWVVERTFAWISRSLRMSRDYEFLAETAEALIYVCMIRVILKRLVKGLAWRPLRHRLYRRPLQTAVHPPSTIRV